MTAYLRKVPGVGYLVTCDVCVTETLAHHIDQATRDRATHNKQHHKETA